VSEHLLVRRVLTTSASNGLNMVLSVKTILMKSLFRRELPVIRTRDASWSSRRSDRTERGSTTVHEVLQHSFDAMVRLFQLRHSVDRLRVHDD